jgi:hypothetical protein
VGHGSDAIHVPGVTVESQGRLQQLRFDHNAERRTAWLLGHFVTLFQLQKLCSIECDGDGYEWYLMVRKGDGKCIMNTVWN